jgi:hypothetical protein
MSLSGDKNRGEIQCDDDGLLNRAMGKAAADDWRADQPYRDRIESLKYRALFYRATRHPGTRMSEQDLLRLICRESRKEIERAAPEIRDLVRDEIDRSRRRSGR